MDFVDACNSHTHLQLIIVRAHEYQPLKLLMRVSPPHTHLQLTIVHALQIVFTLLTSCFLSPERSA